MDTRLIDKDESWPSRLGKFNVTFFFQLHRDKNTCNIMSLLSPSMRMRQMHHTGLSNAGWPRPSSSGTPRKPLFCNKHRRILNSINLTRCFSSHCLVKLRLLHIGLRGGHC